MANQRKGVSPEKQAWSLNYTKNSADRLRGPHWSSKNFVIAIAVCILVGVAGLCIRSSVHSRSRTSHTFSSTGAATIVGISPAHAQQQTQPQHAAAAAPHVVPTARPQPRQAFPWQQRLVNRTLCTDACPGRAKDGVCDDGRHGTGQEVFCDLGTDCSDCGPWKHLVPAAAEMATPVADLRELAIQVYTKWAHTQPSFLMAYTNPDHDVDVSGQMHFNGNIELGLTQVWYTILSQGCTETIREAPLPGVPEKGRQQQPNAAVKRRLVVDVGANFGYYSLYAAAHGCRVVAWEPVPQFRRFLEYGLQLNGFLGAVEVRRSAVADVDGALYALQGINSMFTHRWQVPHRGIWGTASVGGGNIDRSIDNVGEYERIEVAGERVDSVVQEDVLLMKVDVEGFEPTAFQSSKGILDSFRVEHIIMEYSPGVYDVGRRWDEYLDWPKMLIYLLEHGYTLLHVRDELASSELLGPDYQGELPPMEEILAENLQYDLDDAKKLQERTLGCHPPKALAQRWPLHWAGCNFIPEDLHPKSFRGYFGHNTNVWAAASRKGLNVGQAVGVQWLDQNSTDWYGRDAQFGIGRRECRYLDAELQVRHRCPCLNLAVCGEEAQVVEGFARQGVLVPNAVYNEANSR